MYCEKCGTKNDNDAQYCWKCGEKMSSDGSLQAGNDDTIVWDTPSLPNPSNTETGKNKVMWIVSISVTAAIFLVTAVILWFLIRPESGDESEILVNPNKTTVKEAQKQREQDETDRKTEKQEIEVYEKEETPEIFPDNDKATVKTAEQGPYATEQRSYEESSFQTTKKTTAALCAGSPDLASLREIPVIAANATSTISQAKTNNNAMLLFDKKDDTSWQEGVSGYGINESVSFSFDDHYKVKYIAFKLGNWKNDKYYFGNAKPKTMTLVFGDYTGQVTFTGERKIEWVEVEPSVNADSMRLEINDVYPGTNWEDTCITEVTVYGE